MAKLLEFLFVEAFYEAVHRKQSHMSSKLLQHRNENLNRVNDWGWTAVTTAATRVFERNKVKNETTELTYLKISNLLILWFIQCSTFHFVQKDG